VFLAALLEIVGRHLEALDDLVQEIAVLSQS